MQCSKSKFCVAGLTPFTEKKRFPKGLEVAASTCVGKVTIGRYINFQSHLVKSELPNVIYFVLFKKL